MRFNVMWLLMFSIISCKSTMMISSNSIRGEYLYEYSIRLNIDSDSTFSFAKQVGCLTWHGKGRYFFLDGRNIVLLFNDYQDILDHIEAGNLYGKTREVEILSNNQLRFEDMILTKSIQ